MSRSNPTGTLEQILGINCGKKVSLFDFDVTLGRSKNAYISSQDPNVSRFHCALKYTPSGWLIKDLGSVNGTYVDNRRIPSEFVPLKSGSSIYFGPKEEAPEGYKFEAVGSWKELVSESDAFGLSSADKCSIPKSSHYKNLKKRISLCEDEKQNHAAGFSNGNGHNKMNTSDENCVEDGYHSDSSISSLDSLKTRIRKAKSSERRKEKRQKVNFTDNSNIPSTSNKLSFSEESSLDRFFYQIPKLEDSESLLNKEHGCDWNLDVINHKKIVLENNVSMTNIACSDDLNSNSVAVHSDLLKTLEKKVNDLQTTLKTVNLKFLDTLNENARLAEVVKSKEQSESKLKEDVLKITEEDLICNICTEIFIKPITLGCSHTFCHYCIFEWKKKKRQCPICRERIETETTVLYMDNYVNKIIALLDPRSLEKRIDLIKSREEEMKKKKTKKKKSKGRSARRIVSRGIPSVSDVASRMERIQEQIIDIASYANNIQNYVDEMDDVMQEENNDDDDDIQEIGGYYGGYGMCYNCGRPGHWANGCPY